MDEVNYSTALPKVIVSPPSPSGSVESFETAPDNIKDWDLSPYHFRCPLLSAADCGEKEYSELATVQLPDYHLLIDHTLGVVWRSISHERNDVRTLAPNQIQWAIKTIEGHRDQHSGHSEDTRMIIQYLREIAISMCAGGSPQGAKVNQRPKEESSLVENSFVLTDMQTNATGISSTPSATFLTPTAASTPVRNDPYSTPQPKTPPPTPRSGSSSGQSPVDPQMALIRGLESLQQMLSRWKSDQLVRINRDMLQLQEIEKLLASMETSNRAEKAPLHP